MRFMYLQPIMLTVYVCYVCTRVKSVFVRTQNQHFNYTMRSIKLRKTPCIYIHFFLNELFSTMAVKQRQHVDAVGCRTIILRADQHVCV
jgi:hypothetical protein